MIKVTIIKLGKEYGFFKCPADQVDAEVARLKVPAWGKSERWVREGDEDISQAIETRQVEVRPAQEATTGVVPAHESIDPVTGEVTQVPEQVVEIPAQPAEFVTEYKLAAEYTIEVLDITAEVEAEKQKQAQEKLAVTTALTSMRTARGKNQTNAQLTNLVEQMGVALEKVIQRMGLDK